MDESTPPQSEWDQLRAQLREHPVDADGWLRLVDLAESSHDMSKITETYEAMLEVYPNTPSIQLAYLSHFLDDQSQFKYAEELFKKFLLKTTPSVELLKYYLTYIRRITKGPDARQIIKKCYDFATTHASQDKDSFEIWQDYLTFLKEDVTNSTWEEQQKMDAMRKVYQQAVQIPMENVKKIWEEYQEFENRLNKITAKKFISDLQESHMQARTVYNQLQEHLAILPAIWLPRPPTFSSGDKSLIARWRQYLKWEESNPLEIDEANRGTLIQRVQGVYKKATVRMRFYPEIWYMAYVWTNSVNKTEEALNILKAGVDANPASFVLNFAYTEALELAGNFAEVHATFEKFLGILKKELEGLEAKANANNSSSSSIGSQPLKQEPMDATPTAQPGTQSQNSSLNTQASDEKPPKNKEFVDKRTDYGIAWIMYIRFARRAEGLKSARIVFGKARRDRLTPWEVHESEALMEYHCGNKDVQVASRIFEKGMEAFGDEVEYVLRYLGFLISINDENNARALFERVIGTFPPDKARPLWDRWARYEYQYGDISTAHKFEKRMSEVYPNGMSTSPFPYILSSQSSKRAASPEHRRRDESRDHPSKRARPSSPAARTRDRERWDHRRHASPGWEREREPPPPKRAVGKEREEEKGVQLPSVINWFVSTLPAANTFDGPVFRTDDLMQLLRTAVIPSSSAARARSPPPAPRPGGGRPPPDYGPYQGPNSGGRRGRW
ncbi:hypothetical protein C8Q80DRAFT_1218415 [Daedaleopsis nitida]|nr:hypothetical protein C8Q80DRAFT_1218415 [Daedaleopsis nitida]